MNVVAKILAYCLSIIVGGALLAPPLWWAAQAGLEHGVLPEALRPFKFPKYFNRAVLVVALGLLVPFIRWLGLRRWTDLGLAENPRRFNDLALGLAVGSVGLWSVAALLVLSGRAELRESWPWTRIAGAAVTAAVVACIEEIFFRGALFGVLRRAMSWPRALTVLSVFFAAVHFIKPNPRALADAPVQWWSGFALLPHAFSQFTQPALLLGGLTTLALVGWTLGFTVVRTRSLYWAIGLHAGWVFALRSFSFASVARGEPSLWLGRDLVTGLVPLALLAGTLGIVAWLLRDRAGDEPVAEVSR